MEPTLDGANTGGIRRHLAAALADLDELQALLAPMLTEDPGAAKPTGGDR